MFSIDFLPAVDFDRNFNVSFNI